MSFFCSVQEFLSLSPPDVLALDPFSRINPVDLRALGPLAQMRREKGTRFAPGPRRRRIEQRRDVGGRRAYLGASESERRIRVT
jgi:hypothetical protein